MIEDFSPTMVIFLPASLCLRYVLIPREHRWKLEEVLHDGQPVETLPSSFEEAAPLEELPLSTLAGFCVSDIYPLENCKLEAGLYSTWFAYRKGPERKEALVLVREDGAFLMAGYRKNSPLVGLGIIYDFFDAASKDDDTEDEDDLDFAMM